jgi:hypothetical protein
MTIVKRRVVAYVVERIACNTNSRGIFDMTASQWSPFTSFVTATHLTVYDHDRASTVIVTGPRADLYIYDSKTGLHIKMKIDGGNFSGYDFEAMAYFSGTVSGPSVFFCDFQHSDYFKYSTQPPPGSKTIP